MSTPFPDYAKSTHPDVLEALRETLRRRGEFMKQIRAASEKYTGKQNAAFYGGWLFVSLSMTGISRRTVEDMATLTGQWKKPDGDVLAPYKNNPSAKDFEISMKAPNIPGRENLAVGHGRMGTGQLFEFGDAVYSRFGFERDPMNELQEADAEKFGWREILASEFHKAKEGYQAAQEAKA